ncbi:MAG: hypothetical protein A2X08_09865 [Bacteroidetes bacterium GWA2_32_17]|nr:MAG: hypothetical protein A2X08_09865 [Bacteroidetes bacterium GWA2_32_17]
MFINNLKDTNIIEQISKETHIEFDPYYKLKKEYIETLKSFNLEYLFNLTSHPNPNVRYYSIFVLTQYFDSIPYLEIAKKHINDTIKLTFKYLDYNMSSPYQTYTNILSEEFIRLIGTSELCTIDLRNIQSFIPYLVRTKNEKGKREIDSLLICSLNNLEQTKQLLTGRVVIPGCYKQVRKKVKKYHDPYALIALSKYKRSSDIHLLLKYLNSFDDVKDKYSFKFLIFIYFQHSRLFKWLNDNMNTYYRNSRYQQAIAQYRSNESLELLKQVIQKARKIEYYHNVRESVIQAMKIYKSNIYNDFLFELLEERNDPFVHFPNELWEVDKERAYRLLIKNLEYKSNCNKDWKPSVTKRIREELTKNAPELLERFEKGINK